MCAPQEEPDLPPPLLTRGPLAWMRANLFSSPANAATHRWRSPRSRCG